MTHFIDFKPTKLADYDSISDTLTIAFPKFAPLNKSRKASMV